MSSNLIQCGFESHPGHTTRLSLNVSPSGGDEVPVLRGGGEPAQALSRRYAGATPSTASPMRCTRKAFVEQLSRVGTVTETRSPFPWTMLLVRV